MTYPALPFNRHSWIPRTVPEPLAMAKQFIRWISDQWRQGYRFRIVVIGALVLLLVTFLYPFQTTTVPDWNVRVVDDAGAPVHEINVTEHWQHYLLEADGHEEVQTTNPDGLVSFGPRSIRASAVRRLIARIRKIGSHDDRGRIDRYGAVVAWGNKGYETTVAVYREGEAPQPEIRVRRLP